MTEGFGPLKNFGMVPYGRGPHKSTSHKNNTPGIHYITCTQFTKQLISTIILLITAERLQNVCLC